MASYRFSGESLLHQTRQNETLVIVKILIKKSNYVIKESNLLVLVPWKNTNASKIFPVGEDQNSKDITKRKTTLCATCKRNFKTSRGLIQHQKKCKPSENTNNITNHNITAQRSTEIKVWENLSIITTTSCFFIIWGSYKMEKELVYVAFRKGR